MGLSIDVEHITPKRRSDTGTASVQATEITVARVKQIEEAREFVPGLCDVTFTLGLSSPGLSINSVKPQNIKRSRGELIARAPLSLKHCNTRLDVMEVQGALNSQSLISSKALIRARVNSVDLNQPQLSARMYTLELVRCFPKLRSREFELRWTHLFKQH